MHHFHLRIESLEQVVCIIHILRSLKTPCKAPNALSFSIIISSLSILPIACKLRALKTPLETCLIDEACLSLKPTPILLELMNLIYLAYGLLLCLIMDTSHTLELVFPFSQVFGSSSGHLSFRWLSTPLTLPSFQASINLMSEVYFESLICA